MVTQKYHKYLKSAKWNKKREKRLKRDGYCCRTCGSSGDTVQLDVHHSSYEWFGRERMRDLITLCDECHRAVTGIIRNRKRMKEGDV